MLTPSFFVISDPIFLEWKHNIRCNITTASRHRTIASTWSSMVLFLFVQFSQTLTFFKFFAILPWLLPSLVPYKWGVFFFEPLWTLKIEYSGSWKHQLNTSRVVSTPWPLEKRAIKLYCKYWVVLNTAMTVETYNGTPAQSQVERDKTVATNESSSEKKEGWNSRGAKKATLPFSFFP